MCPLSSIMTIPCDSREFSWHSSKFRYRSSPFFQICHDLVEWVCWVWHFFKTTLIEAWRSRWKVAVVNYRRDSTRSEPNVNRLIDSAVCLLYSWHQATIIPSSCHHFCQAAFLIFLFVGTSKSNEFWYNHVVSTSSPTKHFSSISDATTPLFVRNFNSATLAEFIWSLQDVSKRHLHWQQWNK